MTHSNTLEKARLKLIAEQSPPAFFASNILMPTMLALILTGYGEQGYTLLIWTLAGIALFTLRWFHNRALRQFEQGSKPIAQWQRELLLITFIAGTYWSFPALTLVDPTKVGVSFLILAATFSHISGSVASYASHYPLLLVFVSALWLPIFCYYLWLGTGFYLQIAFLGSLYLLLMLFFGINHRKAVLESLNLRNENLDLLKKVQQQTCLAEEANRAKSRFLAAASHDLRQPLHALGLFASSLASRLDRHEQKEIMVMMQSSLSALQNLFNALLDVSRLDAGVVEPKIQAVHLSAMLDRLIEEYQSQVEDKSLILHWRYSDVWTQSDPQLLEDILRNLIGNAIKYTDSGRIFISVRGKTTIKLQIWDTGRGISESEQQKIFDEFHQVDNPARDRSQGIGLGLSIVKRLAHLLEHNIALKSELGRGSVFSLCMQGAKPQQSSPAIPTLPEQKADSDLRGVQVLIVDDEKAILDALSIQLQDWGCQVLAAGTQAQSLSYLDDSTPDIVISDFRLRDGETGDVIIQQVRERLGYDIPAIIVTGTAQAEVHQTIDNFDLQVVYKPVEPRQLYETMVQALNGL